MATRILKHTSEQCIKKTSLQIDLSPYLRSYKRNYSQFSKKLCESSKKILIDNDFKEKSKLQAKLPKRISGATENPIFSEKAKYFSSKLTHLLSEQPVSSGQFEIYSKIFFEIAEFFPDFKDLLQTLRKGLVISAFKEKDYNKFEFKHEVEVINSELHMIFNKERKDKHKLIKKLNILSSEYDTLKYDYQELLKKYELYEKAVKSNPIKYIEAENLLEKMTRQCQIIEKQNICIKDLRSSEIRLKRILEYCKGKDIDMDMLLNEN
ncbi:hypothetical protein SteCoe_18591 [Stentor coeruleus]|uniref:Uncharacterized protein n=1 Tax=Stentor coeruleus TaxID=5963 RepID=A0A1R2BW60_9CILI|nr:hypothetical protein SteCoe_18591 [Stentor coeruleus]